MISAIMWSLLKKVKRTEETSKERRPVGVPYTDKVAHNLKRVGARYGITVVFSSPNKLVGFINSIHSSRQGGDHMVCNKNHVTPFVTCKKE